MNKETIAHKDADIKKTILTSIAGLLASLLGLVVLLAGYFFFAYPDDADKPYKIFGYDVESMTLAYASSFFVFIAFVALINGQWRLWRGKPAKKLIFGPLIMAGIYICSVITLATLQ